MVRRIEDVKSEILERLPELEPAFQEVRLEMASLELSGGDILSLVLVPFLVRQLTGSDVATDHRVIKRAFEVVEDLAADPHPAIQAWVDIEFVETLRSHPDAVSASREYLGPKTKDFLDFQEAASARISRNTKRSNNGEQRTDKG